MNPSTIHYQYRWITFDFLLYLILKMNEKEAMERPTRRNLVPPFLTLILAAVSVTRLGDLLDFGQLFKAFGNN